MGVVIYQGFSGVLFELEHRARGAEIGLHDVQTQPVRRNTLLPGRSVRRNAVPIVERFILTRSPHGM